MARQPNIWGGGANTNLNGLEFERTTSLNEALRKDGFEINDNNQIILKDKFIGWSLPQHKVYKDFLIKKDIDYREYNSKKWLPDECFVNELNGTVYIIEKKFQMSSGSVDEKLPSCHFKAKEYKKLFEPLGYKVEFYYVFNDWFKQSGYKDTLEYIEEMGCKYFWREIPFKYLGLEFNKSCEEIIRVTYKS